MTLSFKCHVHLWKCHCRFRKLLVLGLDHEFCHCQTYPTCKLTSKLLQRWIGNQCFLVRKFYSRALQLTVSLCTPMESQNRTTNAESYQILTMNECAGSVGYRYFRSFFHRLIKNVILFPCFMWSYLRVYSVFTNSRASHMPKRLQDFGM